MSKQPDLETDFHDLVHMSHIAATLLENSIGELETQEQLTGKPDTFYIGPEDLEAMLFASYEVHSRLKALRAKYLEGRNFKA